MAYSMETNCQLVVFSDKAYNAIIRETFEWEPVETGGILLGHVLDNGCWIVMEVLPPGYGQGREGDNVYHEMGYFEYNQTFVNYLAKSVAEQYEIPLELLGLWHRHPGSMDTFSGTDDVTNSTFAVQNPHGVISGLVNVDPQFRMTMRYLAHSDSAKFGGRPNYKIVHIEVGSDLIPEEYFKLKYYNGEEKNLHPYSPNRKKVPVLSKNTSQSFSPINEPLASEASETSYPDVMDITKNTIAHNRRERIEPENCESNNSDFGVFWQEIKKKKILVAIAVVTMLMMVFFIVVNRILFAH